MGGWPVEARAVCTSRVGWSGSAFVTPERIVGTPEDKERLIFQSTSQHAPTFAQRGTLDGWRAHVASLAAGNSRFVFAISAAFAGPLLSRTGTPGGGLHLYGDSSCGKSNAVRAAAANGVLSSTKTPSPALSNLDAAKSPPRRALPRAWGFGSFHKTQGGEKCLNATK